MTKLEKLRQQLADLKTKGRALLEAAESDDRALTDAEMAEVEKIKDAVAAAESAIKTEEKRLDAARAFDDALMTSTARVPATPVDRDAESHGGFRNTADFAVAVQRACRPGGQVDDRLHALYRPGRPGAAPTNYHQEAGGDAGEGYLVPPAMRDRIWELALEQRDLFALAQPEPTSSRQVNGISDETTPWGSSGIQAHWRAEGTQMSASKIAKQPRSTTLHELYCYVLATSELLEDAPLLNSRIEGGAARAISWKASDSVMWGNGVGQLLGFMESGALVTVGKEGSQTADTIVALNVLKMLARLLMMPGARPRWLANSQVIPQIATLTIGNTPMFIPHGGMSETLRGTLLGYPIEFTEHAKALGDKGDITLVDMQGYEAYRRSQSPDFASSIHLYFDYNIEAFRWIFRVGGQPYLSAPVSAAKSGADSKSHFVTLAERA